VVGVFCSHPKRQFGYIMKRILYIGGFEMPDKNAAAQRVLSIAKAMRDLGYETFFYGISQSNDFKGTIDGFHYEAYPHPKGTAEWFKYALGWGVIDYIKQKSPDYVFLYNYPAVAQERVISYCKRHGIKTVGDITEWYRPTSLPKRIDTWYRMRISNWHLDGIIAISRYLANYYEGKTLIQLPPLVDKQEEKWHIQPTEYDDERIRLVYIGTGSVKDRLDKIIEGVYQSGANRFHLDVIGINKDQFCEIYQQKVREEIDVVFHGRLQHQEALRYLMSADFQIFFRDNIRVNNAGFPTKFVESMSAGIPVITNRISNIGDYINNGINSFMIEHPEEGEIGEVLKRVSNLSKSEINSIKKNCLINEFDYRNYCGSIGAFIKGL